MAVATYFNKWEQTNKEGDTKASPSLAEWEEAGLYLTALQQNCGIGEGGASLLQVMAVIINMIPGRPP